MYLFAQNVEIMVCRIPIKKEIKQEIEPMHEAEKVQEKSNGDTSKRAGDIANFIFDHKDGIPMKKERIQEIKTEPMHRAEKVQEKANRDTLKRTGDVANFIFDLQDGKTHREWTNSGLTFEIFQKVQDLAPFRFNNLFPNDKRPRIIPVKD